MSDFHVLLFVTKPSDKITDEGVLISNDTAKTPAEALEILLKCYALAGGDNKDLGNILPEDFEVCDLKDGDGELPVWAIYPFGNYWEGDVYIRRRYGDK